ncbi:hypothetical protein LTR66_010939, partial [Elasticomyces elasticus]
MAATLSPADLAFASIFPPTTYTTPTPEATPQLGTLPSGETFGGPAQNHETYTEADVENISFSITWSRATRWLSLSGAGPDLSRPGREMSGEVSDACQWLMGQPDGPQKLCDWYINEMQRHFDKHVQGRLIRDWKDEITCTSAEAALRLALDILQISLLYYIGPLRRVLETAVGDDEESEGDSVELPFIKAFRALALHSFPRQRLAATVQYVLLSGLKRAMQPDRVDNLSGAQGVSLRSIAQPEDSVYEILEQMQEVGLGDDFGTRAFVHAMKGFIDAFIASLPLKVDWPGRSTVVPKLREWVTECFLPILERGLEELCSTVETSPSPEQISHWQTSALDGLGRARLTCLFEYVKLWDHSKGAIMDIKEYLREGHGRRQYLAETFCQQMDRRILHAGATTAEILSFYLNVIHVFRFIDPKGVLLDRVARPVRLYLREREDTVKIVAASFLADVDEAGNPLKSDADICGEIATAFARPYDDGAEQANQRLDWDDMEWTPDPIDAGPEYSRSKSEDVVSYVLGLFNQEDFIKELKNILGEHLLTAKTTYYDKEIRLIELLKNRFGQNELQACEVMLKDMLDSKRINSTIRVAPLGAPTGGRPPQMHASILSSHFWPELREDAFTLHPDISLLQASYAAQFERIKKMRRLKWLPALGQVTVHVALEDREVEASVHTWQASVIAAFEGPEAEWDVP